MYKNPVQGDKQLQYLVSSLSSSYFPSKFPTKLRGLRLI